jgi:hypothetical protein
MVMLMPFGVAPRLFRAAWLPRIDLDKVGQP